MDLEDRPKRKVGCWQKKIQILKNFGNCPGFCDTTMQRMHSAKRIQRMPRVNFHQYQRESVPETIMDDNPT